MAQAGEALERLFKDGLVWLGAPPDADRHAKREPKPLTEAKELLSAIAARSAAPLHAEPAVPFGIPDIDEELPQGGLSFGAIHDFYGASSGDTLPCLIPTVLAAGAVSTIINAASNFAGEPENFEKIIFWIGKKCWPTPFVLKATLNAIHPGRDLLPNCLFVDPPDQKMKLWCIETALRSPATAVMTADISRLSFAAGRKLSLLAKKSHTLGLLLRGAKETGFSAAQTVWRITPCPSPDETPHWQVELAKCKGRQPEIRSWIIEEREDFIDGSDAEKIYLCLSPLVADRSGSTAPEKQRLAG